MRGHLRARGKDAWAAVIDYGRGPDGKRIRKWYTIHGTRREAEKELTRLLAERDGGAVVRPERLTVGAFMDRWLTDCAEPTLAGKTYRRYAEIVRLHLKPAFGNLELRQLTPMHLQRAYTEWLKTPRPATGKPLSPTTVLQHHAVLHRALGQAVKWNLMARNPADAVDAPRKEASPAQALTPEQILLLLETAKRYVLHVPVALALFAGLRRGEVFALKWEDVDLDGSAITVRRSLDYSVKPPVFKEPKSASGRRRVVMPRALVDVLREHRQEQEAWRAARGSEWQEFDLVCCLEDGRPVCNAVNNALDRILARAGLPRVRFHDLRHGHGTVLAAARVSPKVISERLGHSNVGFTLATYSHVLPNLQQEAADELDGLLRRREKGAG